VIDLVCKFLLSGESSALHPSMLPVRADIAATDAEVDSIIQATRMKSLSESGLYCHLSLAHCKHYGCLNNSQ